MTEFHCAALKAGSKNTDDLPRSKAQGTKGQGARKHSSSTSSSSLFLLTRVELCRLMRGAHASEGKRTSASTATPAP